MGGGGWLAEVAWDRMNDSLINIDPELLASNVSNAIKAIHKSVKHFTCDVCSGWVLLVAMGAQGVHGVHDAHGTHGGCGAHGTHGGHV